jgi:hypothetical protein
MHCPRWSMSTMMFSMCSGLKRSAIVPAIQTTSIAWWFSATACIRLAQQGSSHDMHTKMRWPPISSTAQTFFLPVVTLFTTLSEFQRFHKTVFRMLIIHSLADPNCILKRRSAHSVHIAIHRLLCYITK